MRFDRHTGGAASPRPASVCNPAESTQGSSLRRHSVRLAILAGVLALAPPAQAAQPPQVADVAQEQRTALVADDRPLRPLPFAQRDLAIMVLGGAVLTAAAAGAPLLFRPLRSTDPAPFRLGSASDPPLASGDRAVPADAPA